MELTPGAALTDTLRLVRPLGTAGRGALWTAADAALGLDVAVKLLPAARLQSDPGAREPFRRGAQAAAQLTSPHIVRVYAYDRTDDGLPYISMELLEGETLSERLDRDGRLSASDTVQLVSQLAAALDELHALRLVHCDVEPTNVLLADPQQPLHAKLLDLDSVEPARTDVAGGLTSARRANDDPLFLSPEQIADSEPIDHHADLWALGVVAYRALTGTVPYAAVPPQALRQEIYAARVTPASARSPELPPAVDAWFARALARRPADRFDSARAMADALADALSQPQLAPLHGEAKPGVGTAPPMGSARPWATAAADPQATTVLPGGAGVALPPLGGIDDDEPLPTAMLPENLQPDHSALGGDEAGEPLQTSVLPETLTAQPAAPPADDAATVELNRNGIPALQQLETSLAAREHPLLQPAPEPWEMAPARRSPWPFLIAALIVGLTVAILVLLL